MTLEGQNAGATRSLTRREFCTRVSAGIAMGALMGEVCGAQHATGEMIRRAIPASDGGESVPIIGMGTWNTFDVGAAERAPLLDVLRAFYASGARLIDSSPMYGNAEDVTGALVEQLGRQRDTFVATKVWTRGREQGLAQIEQSLRLLRTPRLDLLQIHNLLDWRSHIRTLRSLKDGDRVRYIGVTHYTVSSYTDLEAVLRAEPFDFAQFNYSIATRDAERRLLPFCRERGIAVLVNRPFEEGALFTGVRNRRLPAYAAQIGCTSWAQFFLKFIVSHPAVTCVIPATSRVAHMQDNLQAGFGELPDQKLRERMVADFQSG